MYVGVDVGGTCTDLVCVDENGGLERAKILTTPEDQSKGIIDGLKNIARQRDMDFADFLRATDTIVHGTTVATNMMLEMKGATVGLMTSKGFLDIIDVRRNYKEAAFDIRLPPPHPIVPRRNRFGVTERIDYAGRVVKPLDENEVLDAIGAMKRAGAESIAVCYLFSFVNPLHELRTRELIAEHLPDVPVSLSHEILPRVREFERFSTTLVNAFVTPGVGRYLLSLEKSLRQRGFRGELFVMAANGGMTRIQAASGRGVDLVLSGPAGGVVAAAETGARCGFDNVISVDMGGTSYDVSMTEGGRPEVAADAWMNRYRVAIPVLDVHTIGAGGGSIAWIDDGGGFRVGPRSAGARPGPACYGFGGTEPTVTDANLVLGYISPSEFLGGTMPLDVEAAKRAIGERIAKPLGLTLTEAAAGISRIVNNSMSNGIRHVSVSKGRDPRQFALMAFGGAGAIHAGRQAQDLSMRHLLVPKNYAPVMCALGDILADLRVTRVQGYFARMDQLDMARLKESFARTIALARADLGVASTGQEGEVSATLDMRYLGQTHEIQVALPLEQETVTEGSIHAAAASFHEIHMTMFAFATPEAVIEIIGYSIDLRSNRRRPNLPELAIVSADPEAARAGDRFAYFEEVGDYIATPVYDGRKVMPGNVISGPAIIDEPNTSIVIYPKQRATLNTHHLYVIDVE